MATFLQFQAVRSVKVKLWQEAHLASAMWSERTLDGTNGSREIEHGTREWTSKALQLRRPREMSGMFEAEKETLL